MAQRTALISGGGIAGPAAAYWLNAAGWKTTLVERAPAPRRGGYVIDFWGVGYELAERMGLKASIEREGYHVGEVRIVGERGQRVAGFGTRVFDELTDGRFVTVPRSGLAQMLLDAIAPSTEIAFGEEVAAILGQGEDGVRVRMASGAERRFDLVLGADGLHSGVRRLAFGPDERFERPLGYAVAAFEAGGYPRRDPDVYLMHTRPGRMLARFTEHGERSLFLFVFTLDGEAPATVAEQKALLHVRFGADGWEAPQILARLDQTADLYFDRVSQIVAPTWSQGRIALSGDAAFAVSLLAGQGSALAILSGYVLASELADPKVPIEAGLAAYERRLRGFVEGKQAGARRFGGAFAPRTPLGLAFRNLVVRALAIPGLAKLAIGAEIIDRFPLPACGLLR